MKQLLLILSLCWLCSCNTFYVAQNKNTANTKSLGVECAYGDISSEVLQQKIDSVLRAEMERFNTQQHSFAVHPKKPRDKEKDYISIDFQQAKIVGTGGKIAGYTITTLGLAAPVPLIAAEAPLILWFYYWPQHTIHSKVTLSPGLSGEKKNTKNVVSNAGALFASDEKQVEKLLEKYGQTFQTVLLDIETQLNANKPGKYL